MLKTIARAGAALAVAAALAACQPAPATSDGDGAAPVASAPASPAAMPRPKPGKWKMTMDIPGMPAKQTVAICLTQSMIDEMNGYADSKGRADCARSDMRMEAGAVVTSTTCGAGAEATRIVTRATGDFNARYTVDTAITTGQGAAASTTTSNTVAEYMGPC